jgi:glucose dehydrogenase
MQKKALFGTLALLALAGVVFALNLYPRDSRLPTVRPVTDSMLGDAAGSGDWLTYGRDYANQRFAPFTQINRQTIQRLEPLWRQGPRRLLKSYLRTESTPVVVDGMLIYTDPGMRVARPGNHVIAVDLRTGRALWSWYHGPSNTALCCGLVNRGVALHGNKVYVGTLDARLVALDRRTGKVVWDQQVAGADPAQGYSFTMAPLAAGGKIIIGTSGEAFSMPMIRRRGGGSGGSTRSPRLRKAGGGAGSRSPHRLATGFRAIPPWSAETAQGTLIPGNAAEGPCGPLQPMTLN